MRHPLFTIINSWSEVLGHASANTSLYYQAPLDGVPRPIIVRKLF
jgi:hypothetical protein